MTIIITLVLILLALIGTPLYLIIAAIPLAGNFLQGGSAASSAIIIGEMFDRLTSSPTLLAIPLFTFAGYALAESKTPQRMVTLTRALFGWMPGGLAIVALLCCALFTAFTGASGVTIIAIGGLLFPILVNEKYSEKFSLGLLTSSGSLGLLFPPSLPIILFAIVALNNFSQLQTAGIELPDAPTVDNLFKACLLPGILLIEMLSIYSIQHGLAAKIPTVDFNLKNVVPALRAALWELPLPVLIIGGIYGGLFTPTRAAAVTAFYVLVVEVFVYRDLSLSKDIPRIMRESMLLVGSIIVILGMAFALTNYLVDLEVPQKILGFMETFITNKYVFLMMLNIFLLIVGCMMDIFSAIVVVVPLIMPIALQFNVDPIHLGVIFLLNLEIGYSTPPVGLNLFIASFRFRKPVIKLYAATIPFLIILLIALLIVTYFPQLSLWLVK
ncbi:TRAP transporter large permease subunit [candidate division KSB1 bacterium]|nr:TRAP transporter large permease subunit [candidate division KSB1 bacterium]